MAGFGELSTFTGDWFLSAWQETQVKMVSSCLSRYRLHPLQQQTYVNNVATYSLPSIDAPPICHMMLARGLNSHHFAEYIHPPCYG